MISVFDVFKIILGIIISVFILFVLLRFAGSYTEIGESSRQVSVMVNMKKAIEDVYTTGISTDFETKESDLILGYRPPYIETGVSFVDMEPVPLFLVPGEKLSINRNEYDLGWWKFYLVEALPETNILFMPLESDEKTFLLIGNITSFLPSTENTQIKTKIGIGCNGSEYWFGWERYKFLDAILPTLMTTEPELEACQNTEYFKERGFRMVTVAEEGSDEDFVVRPVNDAIGYVYMKANDGYEEYLYKNGLDIVALMLGGNELYSYSNQKFFRELEVAIDIATRESGILLSDPQLSQRCGTKSSEFVYVLGLLKDLIPKVKANALEEDAIEFAYQMKESAKKYRELNALGCA
jgi:hypothetical protein